MTTAPISPTDTIVLDYLAALWAHSEDLAPELRDELMTTVADYIASRRTAGEDPADVIRWLGAPEALAGAIRLGQKPVQARSRPRSSPVAGLFGGSAGGLFGGASTGPFDGTGRVSAPSGGPFAAPGLSSASSAGPFPGPYSGAFSEPAPVARRDPGAVEYSAIGLLTAGAFVVPVVAPVAGTLLITGSPHWTTEQKATAWLLTAGSGGAAFALMIMLMAWGHAHAAAALLVYLVLCAGPMFAGLYLGGLLRRAGGPGPGPGSRR